VSEYPARRGTEDVDVVASSAGYRELIERLQRRIRESQARAARTLNAELVMLYWSIGRDILEQQRAGGWGDGIVARIAEDLRVEMGSARGFSRSNVFYMRKFAALWPDAEKSSHWLDKLAGPITRSGSTRSATARTSTVGTRPRHQRTGGRAAISRRRSILGYMSARVLRWPTSTSRWSRQTLSRRSGR